MSPEDYPYTDIAHRNIYAIQRTRYEGAEVHRAMEAMDELLYPSIHTEVAPHRYASENEKFTIYFEHEMTLMDTDIWSWPFETVSLKAEHSVFLGKAALKQAYKIHISSQIDNDSIEKSRVSSLYYLERVAGGGEAYLGSMIRPNIYGTGPQKSESMTAYDCEQLISQIFEVIHLATADAREKAAVSRIIPD